MMVPRNEITHRVLSMVDGGWVTRTLCDPKTGWRVQINQNDAPDNVYWALATLTEYRLIEAEAKRLIGEAFPHGNPTRERD